MEKHFEKGQVIERGLRGAVRKYGADEDNIRFVLSTERVARDGHVISAGAWRLNNFEKNPVALWAHDDTALPIGRWRNLQVERMPEGDSALFGDLEFASADYDFAATVEKLYRSGALNAVSVRWSPYSWEPLEDGQGGVRFTDVDLLEVSAVPVPADPDAIMVAAQRGIVSPEELDSFAARLGKHPEIIVLGSETFMEQEERAVEAAEEVEVEAAEELVAEDVVAEDAGEPAELELDDSARAEDSGEPDSEIAEGVSDADGGADVSGDPDVDGEDLERATDEEFERAGKKISKGRARLIRGVIKQLDDLQKSLREMMDEADPQEEKEGRSAAEELVDELVSEEIPSEERAADPCPEEECCEEEQEDCVEECCPEEEAERAAQDEYVREMLGSINEILGRKAEEPAEPEQKEEEGDIASALEDLKNLL